MSRYTTARRIAQVLVPLLAIAGLESAPGASARPADHPSPANLVVPKCIGDKVERCVWLRWDTINDKLRGWGDIRDIDDAPSDVYNVKITNIRLIRNGNVYATEADSDDWHGNYDHGYTSTVDCVDGTWSVSGEMWWKNMNTGVVSASTLQSDTKYIDC